MTVNFEDLAQCVTFVIMKYLSAPEIISKYNMESKRRRIRCRTLGEIPSGYFNQLINCLNDST